MKGKYFLDTNIFVYTFDRANNVKREKANELIRSALDNQFGCVSFQVVQEFLNVATRKFESPLSIPHCDRYLETVFSPLCQVFPSMELCRRSLDIMERWQFSFFDSLIVAAALEADCMMLYSEDFQDGQKIQDMTIVNPFHLG